VSSSMTTGSAVDGVPAVTPRIATAALALLAAATERECLITAFASGITPLTIASHLDAVVEQLGALPMGETDCSLPMSWARENHVDVDAFVVYTDDETWAGDVPPARALQHYRDARGIPAKLVVVGMTSDGFAFADPDDAGMLDVVGFDASTPPVVADFARA
jgi:60 kDa SS-A/Ro ribonucleoprotein